MRLADALVAHRALLEHHPAGRQRAAVLRLQRALLGRHAGVELGRVLGLGGVGGAAALRLRDALPRGGDGGHRALVQRLDVCLRQAGQHGARHHLGAQPLGLGLGEDQAGQRFNARPAKNSCTP